jgi:hypothetical protein
MQTFTPKDLDEDILNDLLDEINELYEASEKTLIELEIRPTDNELQRSLFRSIHTIKGDLGLVNFTPMIPLLQHVEDLLDYLRKGQITYTSTMSDLVLLTMDRVKIFVEVCFENGSVEYDHELYNLLVNHVSKITPENSNLHEQLLSNAVLLLDPTLDINEDSTVSISSVDVSQSRSIRLANTAIPKGMSEEKQLDILFFREVMKPIEKRSEYWIGRGDRIAKLAFYINNIAGNPIPEDQLAVACYAHDFGMAFMPLKVLHKEGKLDQSEFNLLRSHVYKSFRLLEHLESWKGAREIVMQHHERIDGTGYPLGIKGDNICDGAKLLAILDTFDAMTQFRAHKGPFKKTKKKAVIEINRAADGQFCKLWMGYFNRGMSKLLTK